MAMPTQCVNVSILRKVKLGSLASVTVGFGIFCLCLYIEFSILLTPLRCDDTHDVTPRVYALAGCDRLVSEPLVIENFILTYDYSISEDPEEEQIEEEPLEEPREKG
ncbi:hypothetical protein Tco_0201658 [Tanacetum coccineum]